MHSGPSSYIWVSEGTETTTEAKPKYQLPSRTWTIIKKLGELASFINQQDVNGGLKPGTAAAKFLCHLKGHPQKLAFMRIYRQIPIDGTEFAPSKIRASQAVPQRQTSELEAFKRLQKCPVVPRLLGYQEGTQGENEIVPGGSEVLIVWEKVPGEPLSEEYFWSLKGQDREKIRGEFRRVYQKFLAYGVMPCLADSTKLIYDASTGTIHISGFRLALPFDTIEQFREEDYVLFGLANRSDDGNKLIL
ncbi:hypothetical protein N7468_002676 [Penicillium chermesinum]|uniref:Uncharacterized protein n=1 Tax=Penicillium chermesinum TaxID=63820 RepID=A0A9W9PL34_9EURO|nr:uncharacterized protein N7468_002676 [Penicillium chermesinum]KAJ5247693.1 hypothetical protein N7468_002676 [Penicillium chermesinum]